ncbi:MAG: hypothetical protein V7720_05630 [Halioglobus sp.]
MKRFDLTFKGDILPDHEPQQVREGFADLFRIRDPLVLEELFSGDAFVLRSNLDRKSAADYFRKVCDIGGLAELVATKATAANSGSMQEVFTRIQEDDPAAFQAGRPARRGEIINAPPLPQNASPSAVSTPDSTPTGPSPDEVLARLEILKQEAETSHGSKIDQLHQMQDEVKRDTSVALENIRADREEALLTAQDEFTRLQNLEADSRGQLDISLSVLDEQETEKQLKLKREITRCDQVAQVKHKEIQGMSMQLELDRESCHQQAKEAISKLEAQIAATQAQAQLDLAEFNGLLSKAESDLQNEQKRLDLQFESLQEAHEQAISSLQIQREEHQHQQLAELEEIQQLHQRAEQNREDRLTQLWEREEQCQGEAQSRLKQLEETRLRHQKSLEQRLQRFKLEEEKIMLGEFQAPDL